MRLLSKAPFLDFDGCVALTCPTCSTDFCAFCFKTKVEISPNGEWINELPPMHGHVMTCPKHPMPESREPLFVPDSVWCEFSFEEGMARAGSFVEHSVNYVSTCGRLVCSYLYFALRNLS